MLLTKNIKIFFGGFSFMSYLYITMSLLVLGYFTGESIELFLVPASAPRLV